MRGGGRLRHVGDAQHAHAAAVGLPPISNLTAIPGDATLLRQADGTAVLQIFVTSVSETHCRIWRTA